MHRVEQPALVVVDAAAVDVAALDPRLEGWRLPQIQGVDRLHVVVTVDLPETAARIGAAMMIGYRSDGRGWGVSGSVRAGTQNASRGKGQQEQRKKRITAKRGWEQGGCAPGAHQHGRRGVGVDAGCGGALFGKDDRLRPLGLEHRDGVHPDALELGAQPFFVLMCCCCARGERGSVHIISTGVASKGCESKAERRGEWAAGRAAAHGPPLPAATRKTHHNAHSPLPKPPPPPKRAHHSAAFRTSPACAGRLLTEGIDASATRSPLKRRRCAARYASAAVSAASTAPLLPLLAALLAVALLVLIALHARRASAARIRRFAAPILLWKRASLAGEEREDHTLIWIDFDGLSHAGAVYKVLETVLYTQSEQL